MRGFSHVVYTRFVILLAAGWVLPIGGPPIRDGRVAIEAGRVAWVGSAASPGIPDVPVRDLGTGVLLPGLVNAHCHLELSYLKGRVTAKEYVPWIEAVVLARGSATEAEMAAAVEAGVGELQGCGTVAVADVSNTLAYVEAVRASGLRAVILHELLGWDPTAAERIVESAQARIGGFPSSRGVTVRLAAHAPHSVSREMLSLLAANGGPAAIHLAESGDEVLFVRAGHGPWAGFLARRGLGHVEARPTGMSPVAYLDSLGVLHAGLVAAHCVQVDEHDASLLALRGVGVALCPRSNARLGVGRPPLPLLLRAGVNVCVGTDSLASADTLNVLEDVAALHRAFPEVDARTLLTLATANGARALGMTDLGVIAPGMSAALAYADSAEPLADPEGFLVSGDARLAPVAA